MVIRNPARRSAAARQGMLKADCSISSCAPLPARQGRRDNLWPVHRMQRSVPRIRSGRIAASRCPIIPRWTGRQGSLPSHRDDRSAVRHVPQVRPPHRAASRQTGCGRASPTDQAQRLRRQRQDCAPQARACFCRMVKDHGRPAGLPRSRQPGRRSTGQTGGAFSPQSATMHRETDRHRHCRPRLRQSPPAPIARPA